VDPAVSEAMVERAAALMPVVRGLRVMRTWSGLRPWLPDTGRAVGPSALVPGLHVATGHEGAGVALGPVTGRLVAQLLTGDGAPDGSRTVRPGPLRAGSLDPIVSTASVNGTIGPSAEATIPVTDEGLLRGDGAFRGRAALRRAGRSRWRTTTRGSAHLRRPAARARLRRAARRVDALLAAAGPLDALLRVVVTRGGARILLIEPLPHRGAVARVATITYAPNRVLDGLKTLSYAGNMLAGRLAQEQGYDEALFVTPHGRVLEGNTWSFFWVAPGGELLTPPLEDRILDSITRARVMAVTGAREAVCTLDDVALAQEAFIASSVREVMPIAAVGEVELPSAPGPFTQRAGELLAQRIAEELRAARAPSPA
jgi:branched-chain amino acid aminotransferase